MTQTRKSGIWAKLLASFALVLVVLLFSAPYAQAAPVILFSENFSGFLGTGFAPSPAAGQLDSDVWRVTGLSDGAGTFGGTHTGGDFARGGSTGGVTTGGVYAFGVGGGVTTLGVQPGGDDFTPGAFTLRIENTSSVPLTTVTVSYDIWVYNDQARANSFNFAFSTNDTTYTSVPALDFASPQAADGSPSWQVHPRSTVITGLNIQNGAYLYLQWQGDDVSGSGSRDEFGLGNVQVTRPAITNLTPNEIPAELNPGWQFWAQADISFGQAVCVEVHPVGDAGNYIRSQCAFDDTTGPASSNWRCDVFTGGVPAAFQSATVEYQFHIADFGSGCANNTGDFTGFNWQFSTGPTAVSLITAKPASGVAAPILLILLPAVGLLASFFVFTRRRSG